MKSTATKNLQLGYGLSLLLLLVSSIASYISIQNLLQSSKQVDRTNEVIRELENTISILKDAETGQRGYLLTGIDDFLEPYNGAFERAESSIAHVRQLTADNEAQQRNSDVLQNIALKRLKRLDQVLNYKKSVGSADVKDMISGKIYMDQARAVVKKMVAEENRLLKERTEKMNKFAIFTPILIVLAAIMSIIITLVSYFRAKKDIEERTELYLQLSEKDQEVTKRLQIIEGVADKISNGNYTIKIEDQNEKDTLGSLALSLNKMAESLQYSFTVLSDNEWLQSSIAALNETMVGEKDLDQLTGDVLSCVVEYTDSHVGAFYLATEIDQLELVSGYALNRNKKQRIEIGEGMVGQVASSKKPIKLDQPSEEGIIITYASGEAKPAHLYILPIVQNDELVGVIEVASFKEYTERHLDYFKSISRGIGLAIITAQNRKRLQQLLEETQAQSEELQAQHSELENLNTELEAQALKLQSSEEELRVQQEELLQANKELEVRSSTLEEKNQLIVERNLEIQRKAEELELSTKYKSEFLANMSHELRTPLNSILLLSRLMTENPEKNLNEDQIEYAKVIQSSGNGLLSLIDEILDLSKIEAGKMELEFVETSLQEIVSDMKGLFTPIARDKGLDLQFEVSSDTPSGIITDKLRLEQILKNLLSNALKFTAKGFVKLSISVPEGNNKFVRFSVTDTGIGIPAEKQKQVFEAFQQADGSTRRKYGGTGLGLSISRELSRLLGGDISLKSEANKGSEFSVVLPVEGSSASVDLTAGRLSTPAAETETPAPPASVAAQEASPRIPVAEIPQIVADDRESIKPGETVVLIVEDDLNFAKTLLSFTRKRGYKGIVATQGDYGIQMARHYKPVAVLLDIQLPVKDGWEVMEELKSSQDTRHIPVHIMSALDAKKESLVKGAVDFINKPIALEQMQNMFSKLEDALNRHPKKVLIIEENTKHAEALAYFLSTFQVVTEIKESVNEGVSALKDRNVDCVILDMGIPDPNAYQALEEIKKNDGLENLPIIIFTGKNLSKTEEKKLKQYADSIVMKTAHSYQRILDEVALFLHLIEEKHPAENGSKKNLAELNEVLENKTVLIADDDVRNIFSLTKALEQAKMKVLSATDGKEALKILEENPQVDVVLMDMMMPEMDGYETTSKIRKNYKYRDLPILAVTAKAMTGDREKCIKAGASDYISKPVDIDQLISLLRVWLYNKNI
ncbi:response regulator [Desertivirga brevis]|uniref:response regulator n=1 Tax=Desertivirga brevis TaxID=2810310 RepID=UPI001A95D089|nr:response regulator [Pedobacter sp. SYSU D00873]